MLDINWLHDTFNNPNSPRRSGKTTLCIVLMLQTMEIERRDAVFLIPYSNRLNYISRMIRQICEDMKYRYKAHSPGNKIEIEDYGTIYIATPPKEGEIPFGMFLRRDKLVFSEDKYYEYEGE